MHVAKISSGLVALSVFLFLAVIAGCGNDESTETGMQGTVGLAIEDNPPVVGWLDVTLPGKPVDMDGLEGDLWILAEGGLVMNWNTEAGEWRVVDGEESVDGAQAFKIVATENGAGVLSPGTVTVFSGEEMLVHEFDDTVTPLDICRAEGKLAVLLLDGSLVSIDNGEVTYLVESSEPGASGSLCSRDGKIAWLNQDGTVSEYLLSQGLLTSIATPEGTIVIDLYDGVLLAGDGVSVRAHREMDIWDEVSQGSLMSNGLIYTDQGIAGCYESEMKTTGLSQNPVQACILDDGTIWSVTQSSIAVWAEIGTVDTRLPEADVHRLTFRMAGQTGGGTSDGSGVVTPDVAFGGVFRIYESVSSRPDPFSEFPAASRDLRRPLEELTIEELHLVGITIDPAGGDQAMVEDANGVAYVLREGTILRNNTRIAEITGNEVIVVQEVTVGSEDDLGGTTSIPTIFSMRLHEEGGL